MDKDEVKTCIRALLSSSPLSYNLKSLLSDFKNTSGCDLPFFEFPNAVEFLKSLTDTVQLYGDLNNPEVCLIESKKSSHITSLVDRQRNVKLKSSSYGSRSKRVIIPHNKFSDLTLEKPISFKNSVSDKIVESESYSEDSFQVTNSSSNYYSTVNSSKVSNKNDTFNSIPPLLNFSKIPDKVNEKKPRDDSFYFEDFSDAESCYSTGEDSSTKSSSCHPPSYSYINDGMKNKLKNLIKEFPNGLWCCHLPDLFQDMYNLVLDYREFGYTSLIQMLSELPDVFRCVRPGNEDWIVFDASIPSTLEERKMMDFQMSAHVSCEIKSNLQKLLFSWSETSSNMGIELRMIPKLYKKMFGQPLDFQSFGFEDLKSFLDTLEGSLLDIYDVNDKLIVVPILNQVVNSPFKWEEALPPITAESDIFYEIFPEDVVGPEESFFELDLSRHIAVGQTVKVCVAEVWSPYKFYLQLHKFKSILNRFMDDLQNFYNVYLNKYKMPDATIRPKQVCVGLYNPDPESPEEWHRARILKVINEKTVSINFVDYGTVTRVKKSQLRFLHRSFWSFPVQAFLARLTGLSPAFNDKRWPVPVSKRFLDFLHVPYLKAEMIDIDFKKPSTDVILYDPFQKPVSNINLRLVSERLAKFEGQLLKKLPSRDVEENTSDLTTTESSKLSTGSVNLNSSGSAALLKENLSLETFGEFVDIPNLENDKIVQIQTKCLPGSETSPSEKSLENIEATLNFKFDQVLDFSGKEGFDEGTAARVELEVKENVYKTSLPASLDVSLDNQNLLVHKTNLVSESSHQKEPERPPPGLVPSFTNFPFLVLEQQQDAIKKFINLLAVEIFLTNSNVKEVALTSPELALKIAMQMAEAHFGSLFPNIVPESYVNRPVILNENLGNVMSPIPTVLNPNGNPNMDTIVGTSGVGSGNPPAPGDPSGTGYEIKFSDATNNSTSCTINNTTDIATNTIISTSTTTTTVTATTTDISPSTTITPVTDTNNDISTSTTTTDDACTITNTTNNPKIEDCVEKVELGGKNLHLVRFENERYFCVEEILRLFTVISTREIADRILQAKRMQFQYKVLTKKADEEVLKALKRHDVLQVFKKKRKKKLEVYLLDAKNFVSYLKTLGCLIEKEAEIEDLLKSH